MTKPKLFRRMALAVAAVTLFLSLTAATPSRAAACQAEPESKRWTWIRVDHKKCWYRRGSVSRRSQLHWVDKPNIKFDIDPAIRASAVPESQMFEREPMSEWPLIMVPEPPCCWPPLTEFDMRWQNMPVDANGNILGQHP